MRPRKPGTEKRSVTVTVHVAKTNLSKLIARVEAGDEVVIARDATPVVKLVPVRPPKLKRIFGALKGQGRLTAAFFEPLPESELQGWE